MTEKETGLVERLRGVWADNGAGHNTEFTADMHEAADTIQRLQAELDAEQRLSFRAQVAELEAELAEVKLEQAQLRKIHPLDIPLEVFLADLTTRPANIIRAELASFAPYAGTGTFEIEPPFTVRHLMLFSRSELRRWPNFGRKCLNEVEEMLRARGLQLWDEHDERSLRLLREHREYFEAPSTVRGDTKEGK